MSIEEFLKAAISVGKMDGYSEEATAIALKDYLRKFPYNYSLPTFKSILRKTKREVKKERRIVNRIDELKSEDIWKKETRSIQLYREQLFGKRSLPFRNDDSARKWIEKIHRAERHELKTIDFEKNSYLKTAIKEMGTSIEELMNETLEYPLKDGTTKKIPVVSFGILGKLSHAAFFESFSTGFSKSDIVWWILRGKKPILPKVVITERKLESGYGGRSRLEIIVNSNEPLSQQELWKLYSSLYPAGKRARQAFAKPYQERLIELVRENGIPKKNKTEFWEGIRRQLMKEGIADVPKYKALMKTWNVYLKRTKGESK